MVLKEGSSKGYRVEILSLTGVMVKETICVFVYGEVDLHGLIFQIDGASVGTGLVDGSLCAVLGSCFCLRRFRRLFRGFLIGAEHDEKQYDENKEVGVYAADKCDYAVLVGKEQTKPIQDGLLEAGFPENKMIPVDDLQEAFRMVNAIPGEKQKVILIENDLPDNYA